MEFIQQAFAAERIVYCGGIAVVNGDTADDVYARVTEVIRDHSELVVWVPAYNQP